MHTNRLHVSRWCWASCLGHCSSGSCPTVPVLKGQLPLSSPWAVTRTKSVAAWYKLKLSLSARISKHPMSGQLTGSCPDEVKASLLQPRVSPAGSLFSCHAVQHLWRQRSPICLCLQMWVKMTHAAHAGLIRWCCRDLLTHRRDLPFFCVFWGGRQVTNYQTSSHWHTSLLKLEHCIACLCVCVCVCGGNSLR